VPPLNGGNGNAGVTFGLTSNRVVILDSIYCTFDFTGTTDVWYTTTDVTGPPNITTANGWTQIGQATINTATGAGGITVIPLGIGITIQPGTSYRFYVNGSIGAGVAYTTGTTGVSAPFTDGIVTIETGNLVGYGGSIPNPGFHPRQFNGGVKYTILGGTDDAAVLSVDSVDIFCSGLNDLYATIANFGSNQIDSVDVNWELNGVAQPSFRHYGLLDTLSGSNPYTAVVHLGNVSLPAGASTLKIFTSDPNGNADTTNFNDTIYATISTAAEPRSITALSATLNSATFTVDGVASTATIDYEYGAFGFTPGSGTSGSATASPFTITGLSQGSTYDLYVRTNCGGGDVSTWVGPLTFNTSYGVPFFEDFETFGADVIITNPATNGWSVTPYNGFGWYSEDASGFNENAFATGPLWDHTIFGTVGGIYAYMETSGGTTGASADLMTPPIFIDPSYSSVELSFWYFLHGVDIDRMQVIVDTNGVEDTLVEFVSQQQLNQTDDWSQMSMYLNGYGGKSIIVKFRGFNPPCCSGDVAIDDVAIDPVPNLSASLEGIIEPNGAICPTTTSPVVVVQNTGLTPLTSVDVVSSVNGSLTTTNFTLSSLPTGDTVHLTLPSITFSSGTLYDLKFYTANPNAGVDGFTGDDTLAINNLLTGLSGNFTINPGLPASGTNFTSFTSLASQLNANGVCGNVNVTVAPGIYNETFRLENVPGLSASQRLTIDGVDSAFVTLSNGLGSESALIDFDGISYTTVKNMTLTSTVNSSYNWGVHFMGGSSDDSLIALSIKMSTTNTFGVYCIGASGSRTDNFAPGNNANNVTVMNCYLEGGDFSVHFEGPNSGNWSVGNHFINNTIFAPEEYGFYLDQQEDIELRGNTINGLRTTSTFTGYGIANFNSMGFKIHANNIEVPYYGIYCTNANSNKPPLGYAEIINNMVTSTNQRGIYLTSALKVSVFHNSVNTTSGEAAFALTGLFVDTVDARNNIFVSSTGPAVFTQDPDSVVFEQFDNNVYNTGGGVLLDMGGTQYSTLAAYTTGQANFGANSYETDPQFAAANDLHIIGATVNDRGDNSVFVMVDIDGDVRPMAGSTFVDPGADEHDPPACPPPSNLGVYGVGLVNATIIWQGSGSSFEYELISVDSTQGSGTITAATNDSVLVSGLTASTGYKFYVREVCSRGVVSPWSGPFIFTTANGIPYFEDFESFNPGIQGGPWPNGWISTSYSGFGWESEDAEGFNENSAATGPLYDHTQFGVVGGMYMYMETSGGTTGATAELVSPPVYVDPSITQFEASYWYFLHGTEIDSMDVYLRSNNADTLLVRYYGQQQPVQTDPWKLGAHLLTGYSGQSVQLVFKGYNPPCCSGDPAIDDVSFIVPADDDLELISIDAPFSSCGLGSTDSVKISFRNAGLVAQSSFPVSYTVNGGTPVTETYAATINSGDTVEYTFTTRVNLSVPGTYDIVAYTDLAADANRSSDTASIAVDNIPIISSYPYNQGFESGSGGWIAAGLNSSWELGTPAGTVINSAAAGTQAWMTGLATNYNQNEASFVVGPCFDFSSLVDPRLSIDIAWSSNAADGAVLQSSIDGGSSWQKVGAFVTPQASNWYNSDQIWGLFNLEPSREGWAGTGAASSNGWVRAEQDLTSLAGQSSVLLRVVFGEDGFGTTEGFAFDNVIIQEAPTDDIGVAGFLRPTNGCGLSAADSVEILLVNRGINAATSVPVSFSVDGGTPVSETYTGVINPGDTVSYVFTGTADLSVPGTHTVRGVSSLLNDGNAFNDTLDIAVEHIPIISTFPYSQGFEAGNAGWTSQGANDTWELGTPAGNTINSAAGGTQAWVTNLTGNYNNSQESFVMGPCFDFSTLVDPEISIDIWWNSESGWDGATLQSSIDGGATWQKVGAVGDPDNWFNNNSVDGLSGMEPSLEGWSGAGPGWVTAKHDLTRLAGASGVLLRVAFGSDGSVNNFDGFAFDNILIQEAPAVDVGITDIIRPASNCGLGATDSVEVEITNSGVFTVDSIPVGFILDNGTPVVEMYYDSIQPGQTANYVFNATVNLSTVGTYSVVAYTALATDNSVFNDTSMKSVINIPILSSFPYTEGFESGNGGWTTAGANNTWELGTPAGTVISSAASGTQAWVTNLDGNYNNNQESYVAGPCFDFSTLTDPEILMDVFWHSESGWDGATLQSSIDGGATWQKVGAVGDPVNWFNDNSIDGLRPLEPSLEGWSGNGGTGSGTWLTAQHDLTGLAGQSAVLLRVAFGSDGSVNGFEGFAFDNIVVRDAPQIDLKVVSIDAPQSGSCSLTSNELVTISVTNLGLDTAFGFPVSLTFNSAPVVETSTATVAPGDTISYTFAPAYDLSAGGSYLFVASVNLLGDINTSNNSRAKTVRNSGMINSIPHLENFDALATQQKGLFSNNWTGTSDAGTTFEWYSNIGLTPNGVGLTGPDADATTGSGTYMYVEADSGSAGDIAWLTSPCYDVSITVKPAFVYRYHMFGAQMGDLTIQVDTNGVWTDLKTFSGQQPQHIANTDTFSVDTIDLTTFKSAGNLAIRFKAVRGAGAAGDAAIDDAKMIDQATGISTSKQFDNSIEMHPNPATDFVTITLGAQHDNVIMEIRDVEGKLINTETLSSNKTTQRIDVSSFAKGVYYVKFTSGEANSVRRLVIH
jgi:hypothetical protein